MAGIRKFNEEKVLDIAIEVFSRKGFNATTMLDLAKETGVQRGSLYNAYKNKEVLFFKVFSRYTENFLILVENELQHPDAKKAFTQLFNTIEKRLCSDQQERGCFSTRSIMEAAQQCPDIHLCLTQFLDGLETIIKNRLEQAIEDEHFMGDVQSTARYLVALTRGIAVIERVYHDNTRISEISTTALAYMPFK